MNPLYLTTSLVVYLVAISGFVAMPQNGEWNDPQDEEFPDFAMDDEFEPQVTNDIAEDGEDNLIYKEPEAGLLENPELFEGDIVGVNASDLEGRNSINNPTRKWDKFVIPYVISNSYSANAKQVILNGINQYHQKTCLKFVPHSGQRDHVFIQPGSGCSSAVGRQGGRQFVSLGNGCVIPGIVVHELMHAVGFWHEQSRPDRDNYVSINWNNIPNNMRHNFMKFSHGEVDTLNLPYDIGSVMHYGAYDFAINRGQPTVRAKVSTNGAMGQRRGFSNLDLQKINKLYKCNKRNGYLHQE